MENIITVIGSDPSDAVAAIANDTSVDIGSGEEGEEVVTVIGMHSDADPSKAFGENQAEVHRSSLWDKIVNQLLPMCQAMLKSREGRDLTRTEEVLREELRDSIVQLRNLDFGEYEELMKLHPILLEFDDYTDESEDENSERSESLLEDERQQCNRLAELVQEYSADDLRSYLDRYPGLVETLGGFLSTAVCQSTLQIKTEAKFSARDTIQVLHEYGADLEFKKRFAFRTLLFEFDNEVTDTSYREQQYECLLYFIQNLDISPATLTCEGLQQEDFRLLEWWYHRDLDIKFAKNIQLFYDMHEARFKKYRNSVVPFLANHSSPHLSVLIMTFLGPLKRVVWDPKPSEVDYDGTVMRQERTLGHRL